MHAIIHVSLLKNRKHGREEEVASETSKHETATREQYKVAGNP